MIGIDLVPWLVGELAAVADDHPLFDLLVIDETSRLKDPSGKRARALLKVAGRFRTRWGLTGTPRPNSSHGPVHADGDRHRRGALGPRLRALAEAALPAARSVRARVGGPAGGRRRRSPPSSAPSR